MKQGQLEKDVLASSCREERYLIYLQTKRADRMITTDEELLCSYRVSRVIYDNYIEQK